MEVLRLSERPTKCFPGKGLASYVLSKSHKFNTVFFSPFPENGDKNISINSVTCIEKHFIRRIYSSNHHTGHNNLFSLKYFLLSFYSFFVNLNILFTLPMRKFDIFHFHHPFYSPLVLWAWFNRIPIVYTSHGNDCKRIKDIFILKYLISFVDIIFCMSKEQIKIYSKLYPKKKIIFASNGVDSNIFYPSCNYYERDNTIICVGSLSWKKDYFTILNAASYFFKDNPNWRLIIVGSGSDKQNIINLAKNLMILDYVIFTGVKDRLELAQLLSKAKIYLINSIQEGLPKSLLEAMASGCACITTDVGECENVLNSCGIVIKPKSVNSTYKALITLSSNHDLANKLSMKAMQRIKGYTWTNYIENHVKCYGDLINSKKQ